MKFLIIGLRGRGAYILGVDVQTQEEFVEHSAFAPQSHLLCKVGPQYPETHKAHHVPNDMFGTLAAVLGLNPQYPE